MDIQQPTYTNENTKKHDFQALTVTSPYAVAQYMQVANTDTIYINMITEKKVFLLTSAQFKSLSNNLHVKGGFSPKFGGRENTLEYEIIIKITITHPPVFRSR